MPRGTRLIAPADGVVVHKGSGSSGGINVILRHEGTWHTVYYHLQKPCPYDIGARVKAGDFLAYSGNTGASTGPHLHWELRRSRKWGDTTDPMPHVVGPYVEPVPEPVLEPEPQPVILTTPLPVGVPVTQAEPVKPTPRPQPVTPKPRPKPVTSKQGNTLTRAEITRIANLRASGSPVMDGPPRPNRQRPKARSMRPKTLSEKLQAFFDMKRHMR
jgi:murein DD-endopeptidase MepM/ murein hydrolase activator NlpD